VLAEHRTEDGLRLFSVAEPQLEPRDPQPRFRIGRIVLDDPLEGGERLGGAAAARKLLRLDPIRRRCLWRHGDHERGQARQHEASPPPTSSRARA
jgi:hypothetical protein